MQGAQGKPLRKFIKDWESKQKPSRPSDPNEPTAKPDLLPITEEDKKLLMDQVEHGDTLNHKQQRESKKCISALFSFFIILYFVGICNSSF